MAIDLETSQPVKQNEFGATINAEPVDLTTAKPVPQMTSGNKEGRYIRPMTSLERDQSTAEMIQRDHGSTTPVTEKISQALETPEARAMEGAALSGTVGLATGGAIGAMVWGAYPLLMGEIKGAATDEIKEDDVWNRIIDNAKKGVLEPKMVDVNLPEYGDPLHPQKVTDNFKYQVQQPISESLMDHFPGMPWQVAATLGMTAELAVTAPELVREFGSMAANQLSFDTQATYAVNKIRQTPEFAERVQYWADKSGAPREQVEATLAQKLFESRKDADYWTMLRNRVSDALMERRPIGLSTEGVSGLGDLGPLAKGLPAPEEMGDKIVGSAIKTGGQLAYGATHEAALNQIGMTKEEKSQLDAKHGIRDLTRTASGDVTTEENVDQFVFQALEGKKQELARLQGLVKEAVAVSDKKMAETYAKQIRELNKVDDKAFASHVKKHAQAYMSSGVDPLMMYKNRKTLLPGEPRKKAFPKTLFSYMGRGSLSASKMRLLGYDTDAMKQGGMGYVLSEKGGMSPDEKASSLVEEGIISPKSGESPMQAMMRELEKGAGNLIGDAALKQVEAEGEKIRKELEAEYGSDIIKSLDGIKEGIEASGLAEINKAFEEAGLDPLSEEGAVRGLEESVAQELTPAKEGEDFTAHLVDNKGNLYTRDQSEALFGVGESEHITEQGTDAAEQRKSDKLKEIQNEKNKAKKLFIQARIQKLEGEAAALREQIQKLEDERDSAEHGDKAVQKIYNDIDRLTKRLDLMEDEINKLYLGESEIEKIRQEVYQTTAKDLLDEQDAIDKESLKIGHGVGVLEERERMISKMEHEITDLKNKYDAKSVDAKRKSQLILLKQSILDRYKLKDARAKWIEKTEKEKQKIVEREARAAEKKKVSKDIKRMAKEINDLPTQNLPVEYKDKIQEIKDNFDLKLRSSKTLAKRESMSDFVAHQLEQGNEITIPAEKLALIHKVPLNAMTYQEIKDVHEAIMRLYHNGRLKDRLLTQQKERSFEKVVNQSVQVITKCEGITPETTLVKALREQDKSFKDMAWEAVRWYLLNNMRPELMYQALDGWTPGIMTDTGWNCLYRADNGEMVDSDLFHTVIGKAHEKLDLKMLHEKADVGRFKNMTKSNALFIYANSFNEGNLRHLHGSGLTDADISAVDAFLKPEEKQAVGEMIKFFDNYMYPRLDKVYSKLEGVHLPKEDNYFPIDRLEDVSYQAELERDLLERSYSKRPGVTKGFTKSRVTSTKGFSDFDYFGTLYRHMDKVSHYLNFAEPVRDVNKFLLNPKIKAAITQKFGKDFYDIIYKHLQDTSYGRLHNDRELLGDVLDFIRTRATPLYLGYNLLTTLKQTAGILQGMEMAGKTSTLKGLVEFGKNPRECLRFVDEKSPMMKYRSMRQEREFQEIIANRSWEDKLKDVTGLQWIQEKSLVPTLFTDRIISNCIWRGAYGESLMKGMDEKAAIEAADRAVRLSQPMGGLIHLPHMFRGSKAQRMMTFLKGHTNKLWNLQLMMIGQKKNGKTTNGRFASQLLFYTLLPAIYMAYLEKKRLPETFKEIAGAIGRQATVSLWGVEDMFRALESGHFVGVGTPLEDYLNKLGKLLTDKKVETKIDDALYLAAGTIGAPYVGIKRILTGHPFGAPEKRPAGQKGQRRSWQDSGPSESRKMKARKVWSE